MSPEELTQGRRRTTRFALIATILLGLEACVSVGLVGGYPVPRTSRSGSGSFEGRLLDTLAVAYFVCAPDSNAPWPNAPAGPHP